MVFRYLGILGGHAARFKTHEEARAYIHAIPGAHGYIIDRAYTEEVAPFGETEEECEPFPLVRLRRLPHYE